MLLLLPVPRRIASNLPLSVIILNQKCSVLRIAQMLWDINEVGVIEPLRRLCGDLYRTIMSSIIIPLRILLHCSLDQISLPALRVYLHIACSSSLKVAAGLDDHGITFYRHFDRLELPTNLDHNPIHIAPLNSCRELNRRFSTCMKSSRIYSGPRYEQRQ